MQLLDPAVNSISYLVLVDQILGTGSEVSSISHDVALEYVVLLLMKFDPRQMRYIGNAFIGLLEKVASGKLLPVCLWQGYIPYLSSHSC